MAEHDSSDNPDRDRLRALEEKDELIDDPFIRYQKAPESLITDDPYPNHLRRRANRRLREAIRWKKDNPEHTEIVEKLREKDQKSDS